MLDAVDIDTEAWRWFWTVLATILVVGEIFSPGFFLLPFGIGAAAAAVLAWLNVNAGVQWAVFLIVSIAALLSLRPLIRKQDEGEKDAVGANRYLRKRGIVLENIDMRSGTGMVRVDTEEWRAVTDGESIAVDTEVIVSGITGSRLVVKAIEPESN
jgi:membrane protein implicated in regulation of membrane protease activity